jgi:hypothetical protein
MIGIQVLRVAVGVAHHERADLRALGHLGHRGLEREALEVRPVRVAGEGIEVVPGEDHVGADLLGLGPGAAHRVV